MGAIARQGPHQVAQKSTSTGWSAFSTSWSKFASVTSTIPLPAIFAPIAPIAGSDTDRRISRLNNFNYRRTSIGWVSEPEVAGRLGCRLSAIRFEIWVVCLHYWLFWILAYAVNWRAAS